MGGQPAAAAGMSDNVASGLCYVFGLITGVLFLVLAPYSQNRNVRFHAFQAIFLSLAVVALQVVFGILGAILGAVHLWPLIALFGLIGMVVWLGFLVLWIFLLVKTFNGGKIVLPVIGPLAQQQA